MKKAVCVILVKGNNVLGVTRKYDHNDFGLPGGKVEDTDPTLEYAIIRETKEETGLDICNIKLVDSREWGGYTQHCYLADYRGFINYDKTVETALVEWVPFKKLAEGSFGEYNQMIFKKLNLI